jgi:hypothetical protein
MSKSGKDVTLDDETGFEMVRKRVVGGYKYVKVKTEVKQKKVDPVKNKENHNPHLIHEKFEAEKHELERSEKGAKEDLAGVSITVNHKFFSFV